MKRTDFSHLNSLTNGFLVSIFLFAAAFSVAPKSGFAQSSDGKTAVATTATGEFPTTDSEQAARKRNEISQASQNFLSPDRTTTAENASSPSQSNGFKIDPYFSPPVLSEFTDAREIAVQPDGKIIAVGNFTQFNGAPRFAIVRLNADGGLDAGFDSGFLDGAVESIALQADGKILIGGFFLNVNSVSRSRVARLNQNGSLDAAFDPGAGANGAVRAIAVQADGKIVIGGAFSQINGAARPSVARLNGDGSLDAAFNAGNILNDTFTGSLETVVLQTDGKILIGGFFTQIGGNSRNRIARLNADGSLDATFNPGSGADAYVADIVLQPDGKIFIIGDFLFVNGIERESVARLNSNGSVDTSFADASGSGNNGIFLNAGALQPDGKILFGGGVRLTGGAFTSEYIYRANANGTVDTTFQAGIHLNNTPNDIKLQADGRIVVAGVFRQFDANSRNGITRLNANGSSDASFNVGSGILAIVGANVTATAIQPDGKILISGTFDIVGNGRRRNLARLNADGSLDASFNAGNGPSAAASAIAVQTDGKILIGGFFNQVNGLSLNGVARLNADGSVDASFIPAAFPSTQSIVIQTDGKILVGGFSGLRRLNGNGTTDATFNVNLSLSALVSDIKVQPDNKILIGGVFSTVNAVNRFNVARLNADGTLDAAFNPGSGANGFVEALAVQPDGKVLIGGAFTAVNLTPRRGIARLNADGSVDANFNPGSGIAAPIFATIERIVLQPNGKVLIGGSFNSFNNVPRDNFARLNADGSLDASLVANTNGTILDVRRQSHGKILIAGNFNLVNNIVRTGLARIIDAVQFDFDGDGRADVSVFRPSTGAWYVSRSSNNSFFGTGFGRNGDLIAPADFDGDGRADISVFRPSDGNWYRLNSSDNSFVAVPFGLSGDLPTPGDFDGDGKSDVAVFRPSTGAWYRLNSSNNQFVPAQWGMNGDKPQLGDFDADGKADLAVWRPSNGAWYVLLSSNNSFFAVGFGLSSDIPTPADYDGDGKTDIAVYRPSSGTWFRLNSSDGQFVPQPFGVAEDKPVPADYDGDGRADTAVFRPSSGTWYLNRSTALFTAAPFGSLGDVPTPAAFGQ